MTVFFFFIYWSLIRSACSVVQEWGRNTPITHCSSADQLHCDAHAVGRAGLLVLMTGFNDLPHMAKYVSEAMILLQSRLVDGQFVAIKLIALQTTKRSSSLFGITHLIVYQSLGRSAMILD